MAGGKKASKPKEKIRHAKLRRKMLNGDSQKKDTDSLRKALTINVLYVYDYVVFSHPIMLSFVFLRLLPSSYR